MSLNDLREPRMNGGASTNFFRFYRQPHYTRLAHVWPPCWKMCKMLDGVGSSFCNVTTLSMLQDVARVWPASSQHPSTRSSNVVRCCVEMLRTFGLAFMEVVAPSARLLIWSSATTNDAVDCTYVIYSHIKNNWSYLEKPFTHASTAGIFLACTPLV